MVRTPLWLLATLAAIGLAHAATLPKDVDTAGTNPLKYHFLHTMPPELFNMVFSMLSIQEANRLEFTSKSLQGLVNDQLKLYGGKVFYDLRRNLDLPDVMGTYTQVGLHTLLDSAQIEYRVMASKFRDYLKSPAVGADIWRKHYENSFPELFQNDLFQEVNLPQFAKPLFRKLKLKHISPNKIEHSLANLGLTSGPKYIVRVIEALLEMLKNEDDLLKNFRSMVGSVPDEQQRDESVASTDQAPAAIAGSVPDEPQDSQDVISADQIQKATSQELSQKFRAFIDQFWFKVIGGGKKEQLRYYLSNMLAFDVIPRILGQALESGKHDNGNYNKALKLAENIHQLPDFAELFGPDSVNAPNYFEFIMLYATKQKLNGFETLLPVAQRVTAKTHRESIRQITRYEFPTNPTVTLYRRRPVEPFDAADLLGQRSYTDAAPRPVVVNPPYLGFDDTFQWEFHAFNATFRFLLEPNHDLIHPEATWSRVSFDHAHVPIDRSAIKIYRGHAMAVVTPTGLNDQSSSPSSQLFRHSRQAFGSERGWGDDSLPGDARLLIYAYDENGQPIFDGSFDVEGITYYVKPITLYEDTKRADDPTVASPIIRSPLHRNSSMIVYRSTDYAPDMASQSSSMLHRRQDALSSSPIRAQCATAQSEWNRQQMTAAVSHQLANLDKPTYLEVPHDPWIGLTRRSEMPKQWLRHMRRDTPQAGCPGSTRVVYFGVAADCTYVQAYQTPDKARAQILSNWNQASAVFERQFNVKLGVIELKILDSGCPTSPDNKIPWNRACASNYPIENRLSDFSQWRGSKGKDSAGLWHLMTNCPTGTEVGIAWLGTLCQTKTNQQSDGGYTSGTGISAVSREEWQIVAHEVGHNFGAIHDCEASTCPCTSAERCDCCPCSDQCNCDAKYIMNPTSPVKTKDFSPCSIERICSTIGAQGSCLKEPGSATVLGEAMCGNGIKEQGEECDCGTPDECENDPCCDGKTCKLAKGAACSDINDLCCSKCQVKPAKTVCRAQYSECDVEEVCDGNSSECPEDKQVEDGTDCGNSTTTGLQCANGQCTSRDAQCQTRGSPLGIKERCTLNIGADPCDFQCNHPSNGLACIFMSGTFTEGTICGWHAKCHDGRCKGDNGFYQFALLFQKNLAVSIPIAILIVLVVLGLVSSLCCRCFRRSPISAGKSSRRGGGWWRSKSAAPAADPNAIHMVPTTSYHLYRGASPSEYTNLDRSGGAGPHPYPHYVDPTPYNGPNEIHDGRDLLHPAPPSPRYLRS